MNNFFKKIFQKVMPTPKSKTYGTHGRIEIPSLFISLPLYDTHGNAQEIVDMKKAAAYIQWVKQAAIVDHSGQDGFERIAKAIPGQTLAYIEYKDGKIKERYICTKKQVGHIKTINGKNKIFDSNGKTPVSGGIVMYTCIGRSAPDVMDVWLTYWKKI